MIQIALLFKNLINRQKQSGVSVIEVVLAGALFVIFSTASVRALLQNYNANRTGAEYTVATQFASEGLEAVKSIKNAGFSNLTAVDDSSRGLNSSGVTAGLVGYWAMDEALWVNDCVTKSVLDSSTNNNNGESCPSGTGSTTTAAGKFGNAGSFDGTNDRVNIDDAPSLDPPGDWTIAGWFMDTNANFNHDLSVILLKGDINGLNGNTNYMAFIYYNDFRIAYSNNYSYGVGGGGTGLAYNLASAGLAANTWIHYAGVYKAATRELSMYINGELVAGPTSFGTANITGNSEPLTLGANETNAFWRGRLDDTRIYNRALSEDEINQIYSSPGGWSFGENGTNNILNHNSIDNYIRTIKVESVNRDGAPPAGNIVTSGGTTDPDIKKVTSTVTWNFGPGRPESLSLVTYLTDWIKAIPAVVDGILVYGRSGNTTPRVSEYSNSNDTFAANANTVTGAAGRNFVVKTSPTKKEAIVGYVDSTTLRVMCYDGANWTNEWSVVVGGNGTTRRFDVSYEYASGDVMVLYSTNTGTNELGYRTKPGSAGCGSGNWASASTFDSPGTTGVVSWVKLSSDSRSGSNILAASWADLNRDLQAAIWNGSAWTQRATALETDLECRGTCTSSPNIPNGDSFDIDFETQSGHLMVVWGSGGSGTANGAWYNKCDGGALPACTWNGSRTAITSLANDATSLDISSNPDSDDILFASIGDGGSDLQAARWSGTAWTGSNDLDATALTPVANSSMVATGWLINGATTRGVVVFANSGVQGQRIHGFAWDGSSFVRQGTDTIPWYTPDPLLGTPRWYDIQLDPKDKSRLMFLVSNSVNDLYAKRLSMDGSGNFTWTDPTYADGTAIEAGLVQGTTSPYYFGYWRNP